MSDTMTNGRVQRKSLGDQIDRLHSILDGLSDALAGSVTDAVHGAVAAVVGDVVRQAVEAAVTQVLANRTVVQAAAAQHGLLTPAPAAQPTPAAEPQPGQAAQETTWHRL